MFFNGALNESATGKKAIANALADPNAVRLFCNEGKYYCLKEDVCAYKLIHGIEDMDDALVDIADANKIDFSDIKMVDDDELTLAQNALD